MDTLAAQRPMAKNKPSKKADQHTSSFMVRLPEKYRSILQAIEARTGRPMTVSVRLALEKHAKELGVDFTPSWPELL